MWFVKSPLNAQPKAGCHSNRDQQPLPLHARAAEAHDGPLLGPCDLRSDPAADSRRNLCSHVRLAGDPRVPWPIELPPKSSWQSKQISTLISTNHISRESAGKVAFRAKDFGIFWHTANRCTTSHLESTRKPCVLIGK